MTKTKSLQTIPQMSTQAKRFYVVLGGGRVILGPFAIETAMAELREANDKSGIIIDSNLTVLDA